MYGSPPIVSVVIVTFLLFKSNLISMFLFFFQITERDLIPNGRNIRVTNDNKLEYIEWVDCLFYDVLYYYMQQFEEIS